MVYGDYNIIPFKAKIDIFDEMGDMISSIEKPYETNTNEWLYFKYNKKYSYYILTVSSLGFDDYSIRCDGNFGEIIYLNSNYDNSIYIFSMYLQESKNTYYKVTDKNIVKNFKLKAKDSQTGEEYEPIYMGLYIGFQVDSERNICFYTDDIEYEESFQNYWTDNGVRMESFYATKKCPKTTVKLKLTDVDGIPISTSDFSQDDIENRCSREWTVGVDENNNYYLSQLCDFRSENYIWIFNETINNLFYLDGTEEDGGTLTREIKCFVSLDSTLYVPEVYYCGSGETFENSYLLADNLYFYNDATEETTKLTVYEYEYNPSRKFVKISSNGTIKNTELSIPIGENIELTINESFSYIYYSPKDIVNMGYLCYIKNKIYVKNILFSEDVCGRMLCEVFLNENLIQTNTVENIMPLDLVLNSEDKITLRFFPRSYNYSIDDYETNIELYNDVIIEYDESHLNYVYCPYIDVYDIKTQFRQKALEKIFIERTYNIGDEYIVSFERSEESDEWIYMNIQATDSSLTGVLSFGANLCSANGEYVDSFGLDVEFNDGVARTLLQLGVQIGTEFYFASNLIVYIMSNDA